MKGEIYWFSGEQCRLLILLVLYHILVCWLLPPESIVGFVEGEGDAPFQFPTPCFSVERQDLQPWDRLHPCVIKRKNGSGSDPLPANPAKSIFMIEHSPLRIWKIAYSIINLLTNLKSDWRVQIMGPMVQKSTDSLIKAITNKRAGQ